MAGTANNGKKKPRIRWVRWLIGLAALAGVAKVALMMSNGRAATKDLDKALIAQPRRGDLKIDVIETGRVQPRERVEVKSKVAGQVEKVFVDEGQHVKKNQKLLRLDDTDYRREVERCDADVAAAKLAVEYGQLFLDRRKKGLEARGVAQADVDFADNDLASKKVSLDRAKVALVAARDKLRYTEIDAPLDGTVIERGIRPGEVVTPGVQATFEGKALLTIADLSVLIVKADLNQIDVAKVKLGQKVSLTLDALPGKTYEALVTKVAPASTLPKGKDVEVFPIEATLTVADTAIKPGMTADVRIHIETRPGVLMVPIEAVVKEQGRSYITKITDGTDGKPRTDKVEIKVGARNDRDIEVLDGIKEGERLMIKPASAAENEWKG